MSQKNKKTSPFRVVVKLKPSKRKWVFFTRIIESKPEFMQSVEKLGEAVFLPVNGSQVDFRYLRKGLFAAYDDMTYVFTRHHIGSESRRIIKLFETDENWQPTTLVE